MTTTKTPVHVRLFPPHGKVVEDQDEYVVELDVAEFAQYELSVRADEDVVTVTGDQRSDGLYAEPLTLSERLEESVRLPTDACLSEMRVEFDGGTLEIHIPRARFRINSDAAAC